VTSAGQPGAPDPAGQPRPSASSVATTGSRGALSVVAFTGTLNVVQLVSSLVLARELAPEQYGAFAVGATIVGFGRFLGDGGAGNAVIQQPGPADVGRDELGRALWLQTAIGLLAAGLLIVAAPWIRSAFDAPRETIVVIVVLALAMLIEVPSVVPKVRLRRQQRYQRIQLAATAAFAALYAVQIGGLLAGYELWALVAGQVAFSIVWTVVTLGLGGGLVRPVYRGALSLARRGLPYQGAFIVQALFAVCSVAVVATQLTTAELGLYTWCTVLATPLISLAHNLHGVAFPALSRLHEYHADRHAEAVAMIARLQFLFVSAAVGLLCGLTVPLIRYVFDEKWLGATDAARAALLGVLPLILAALLAASLESSGRPQLRLRAMAVSTAVGVVVALPMAAALGTTGAAVAIFLLVPLLDALLLLRMAQIDVRRACLNAVVVGSAAFVLATVLSRDVTGLSSLLLAGGAAGLLTLVLLPLVDWRSLRTGWSLVRGRSDPATVSARA
jgi:lipopolysaccharide exporter